MKTYKKHGPAPYRLIVLHGGPGAPGQASTLAKELSSKRGVIEHLQRGSSIEELKSELKTIIDHETMGSAVLVGHSWGAWLAWIFAAAYPEKVDGLILVSAGAFEEKYNQNLNEIRLNRLSPTLRKEAVNLMQKIMQSPTDSLSSEWFSKFGELMEQADSYNTIKKKQEKPHSQPQQYLNLWPEAERLRKTGRLIAMASNINCSVISIHGDYDPHPAEGVKKPLEKRLDDFRFIQLKNCGHYPWKEKEARKVFYQKLKDVLDDLV